MSLISMATGGLRAFATTISNTVINTVSNTMNGYANEINSMVNSAAGKIGNFLNKSFNLSSGLNSLSESSAGTFRAGGNKRDNSIFDYLTNFNNGIMKSNRFRAEFKLPNGVSGGTMHAVNSNARAAAIRGVESGMNSTGQIDVKCHTATFPARSIQTLQFRSNSVQFNIPYMTSYEPITLTFYADGNMDSREYFELWQSCIMNFGNNTTNFYNEYISDVKLYIQNDFGADTYGIILYECYPVNIAMVDMSYSASNMPLNIMITLQYKSWLPLSNTNHNNFNRTV